MALAGVLAVWSVNYIVAKITLTHIAAITLIPFRAELICSLLLAIYFAQPRARRTPLRRAIFSPSPMWDSLASW